jgi:hypothetical protein
MSRFADAADAELARHGLDKARVLNGVGTHLVVQMGDAELQGESLSELPERVQQNHRIGATGDRDKHGLAAPEHLMGLDRLLHLPKEGSHSCNIQGERVG